MNKIHVSSPSQTYIHPTTHSDPTQCSTSCVALCHMLNSPLNTLSLHSNVTEPSSNQFMLCSTSNKSLKPQLQGYYDYTKIDSFIWSGSYKGQAFITYPKEHQWKATLNEDAFKAYLTSVFQRMKDAGMNQVDLSFAQISSINALLSGDYPPDSHDPLIQVLKNEQFLGSDGQPVDMMKLFIDQAHDSGIQVDLSFGGQNASSLKICGDGETAQGQARKLAQFMENYHIDAVDFDLEETGATQFAETNSPEEQRTFFQELHQNLAPHNKKMSLTLEGSHRWVETLKAAFYDDQHHSIFGQLFDGLNLMLYSQSQYYIDAKDSDQVDWGIEGWLDIIGKENASKIHIGFEDKVPYEQPTASAGKKYHVDTTNRGQAAAEIYRQLLDTLKKDGYPAELGGPFWWPDSDIDDYNPDKDDSVISQTMVDFYTALHEKGLI